MGISGWRYAPWRKVFYPPELPQRAELAYASQQLNSVELNGSFYSLQRPDTYQAWHDETPDGFMFAVKGGRFITHNKKLRDCEAPLANFFASGVLRLREKLGPILWQLPPQLSFSESRLREFFELLPRTFREAKRLASRHDHRVKHVDDAEIPEDAPLRYAMEVRHPDFACPEFIRVLRRADVALCVADTAGTWPYFEDVTSSFVYVRLHGAEELYASGYGPKALDRWAARIRAWRAGRSPTDAVLAAPGSPSPSKGRRDVFVYFDNDIKVRAPFDAMSLAARLSEDDEDVVARHSHSRRPRSQRRVSP